MKLKSLIPLVTLSGALATSPSSIGDISNHNPGNIRTNTIKWKGAVGQHRGFVKFASAEDGIRAMARILKTYQSSYNLKTIAQIIGRWAPAVENDTSKYVEFISQKLNKKPSDQIDMGSKEDLAKLIAAMIHFENGSVPYDAATIMRGIEKSQ
jgi:hypothetical protein